MATISEMESKLCRRCGEPLAGPELSGNCPRCLTALLLVADSSAPTESSPALVLRRIGDYELLEEIARGGMGVVFRARQMGLDRVVAVKLLRDSALAQPEEVKRFRAEASAAGRLKHPNIVAIHDVGADQGQHYLVMDLVAGPNLAQFTHEGPLEPRRAAEITARIADAVQYAHAQGILHRDLKPSNVLMDTGGEVFVTDFGLARPLDGGSSLTLSGQVLGTPAYMSPEQAGGRSDTVGPTADVYSMGALLFHLLTGRPPFVSNSLPELMRLVAKVEPLSPQLLNPSVPRDLATVCLKCLAKRPGGRYGSAREFAEDLRRFLRQEPVLARPATRAERLWRWCRREPALATALAFAFFVLNLGGAAVTWQWRRAEKEAHTAKEELWHAQLQEARSYRLNGGAGQRTKNLEVVGHAAAYRPSVELRNEAIAALVLPDLGSNVWWHAEDNVSAPVVFTHDLAFFVRPNPTGHIAVCHATNQSAAIEFEGESAARIDFAAFSPDDRLLAVRFADGVAGLWDWREKRLIFRGEFLRNPDSLPTFDFTPDGREFWLLGKDSRLQRYSTTEGQLLPAPPLDLHGKSMQLDSSGRQLLAVEDERVSVWDLIRQARLGEWAVTNRVCSLAWHPDSMHFVIGTHQTGMWLGEIGLPDLDLLEASSGNGIVLTTAAFTPDGNLILAGGWGDYFGVWDSATRRLVLRSRDAWFGQINRAGSEVAMYQDARGFGVRRFLQPVGVRRMRVPADLLAYVTSASWHPSGRWLLTGHPAGWALWEMPAGTLAARRVDGFCRSIQFLPGGDGFVVGGDKGPRFWPFDLVEEKPHIGEPRSLLPANSGATERAAISPDGKRFAAVGSNGAFHGSLLGDTKPLPIPGGAHSCFVQFSPDGQWICISNFKGTTVNLHSAATGDLVTNLPTGGFVAWFVPGRNELVARAPSELTWWEIGSWKLLRRMRSSENPLPGDLVDFWPDGSCALANNRDQMLCLWDLEAGQEIATFRLPESSGTWGGVFAPGATRMATTGSFPHFRVYDFVALRRELRELGLDWPGAQPGRGFVDPDGEQRAD